MTSTEAIAILNKVATLCDQEGAPICRGEGLRSVARHIEDLVEYINNIED